MAASKKWIALLRAILPATHKKMSMQDLRTSSERAGLEKVSTYIASGNLLFTSSATKAQLIKRLHDILAGYELQNSVILRTLSQLKSVISASPFAHAARTRPNHLLVIFYDKKLSASAVNELSSRDSPERVLALDRELFYYLYLSCSPTPSFIIDRILSVRRNRVSARLASAT